MNQTADDHKADTPLSQQLNNSDLQLREQLLKECKSMARYTMASGIKISSTTFQTIEAFEHDRHGKQANKLDVRLLVTAHNTLTHAIAPAKPRTILLLDPEFAEPSIWAWVAQCHYCDA